MALPSEVWPHLKSLNVYCRRHDSGCSLLRATPSPASAFHQKWLTPQAPQVPPGFKFTSTLCSWLCSDRQNVSSLRKIAIAAGHHFRYVLMTLRDRRLFAEQPILLLLPPGGFLGRIPKAWSPHFDCGKVGEPSHDFFIFPYTFFTMGLS